MALTAQERERLAALWRELARRARHFAAEPGAQHPEFQALAAEGCNWASPLDGFADSFVLFGFGRLAAGVAKTRLAQITPRARALAHLAEVVDEMLGPPPEPQRLPYRADIDG